MRVAGDGVASGVVQTARPLGLALRLSRPGGGQKASLGGCSGVRPRGVWTRVVVRFRPATTIHSEPGSFRMSLPRERHNCRTWVTIWASACPEVDVGLDDACGPMDVETARIGCLAAVSAEGADVRPKPGVKRPLQLDIPSSYTSRVSCPRLPIPRCVFSGCRLARVAISVRSACVFAPRVECVCVCACV